MSVRSIHRATVKSKTGELVDCRSNSSAKFIALTSQEEEMRSLANDFAIPASRRLISRRWLTTKCICGFRGSILACCFA